jgi:hypothetical protein
MKIVVNAGIDEIDCATLERFHKYAHWNYDFNFAASQSFICMQNAGYNNN